MVFYQLPMNFGISYTLFHVGNLVSTLLVLMLLIMYQVSNRNRLLRSTCYLCFCVSISIFVNLCRWDAHIFGGQGCQLQALILNYFYVSLHAHFCFFMVNSCFAALNWSFFGTKSSEKRTSIFIAASWLIPILPTAFAIWLYMTNRKVVVLARHFYCAISSPSWPLFRFWFFAFSIPGLFYSFFLLFCTWRYRQISFRLSKTTQIDKSELFRLILAICLYIFLIALSVTRSGNSEAAKPVYTVPVSKNPFKTPSFCVSCDRSDYFCARLCPTLKSFLPVLVGFILFAMYGFGAVASKCYKRLGAYFYAKLVFIPGFRGGRRTSTSDDNSSSFVTDKRRVSSSSTAFSQNSQPHHRQSLPFAIFSPANDLHSTSFSQILHPNLSVVPDQFSISSNDNDSSSLHHQTYSNHRHHPSLPSIDEDLEVLFMNVNSRPAFRRQFHRRFSEPQIYNLATQNIEVTDPENTTADSNQCENDPSILRAEIDPEIPLEIDPSIHNNKDTWAI